MCTDAFIHAAVLLALSAADHAPSKDASRHHKQQSTRHRCCIYTCASWPLYVDKYKKSQRTAAGADKWLDTRLWDSTADCLGSLKAAGYQIVTTHLSASSITIQVIASVGTLQCCQEMQTCMQDAFAVAMQLPVCGTHAVAGVAAAEQLMCIARLDTALLLTYFVSSCGCLQELAGNSSSRHLQGRSSVSSLCMVLHMSTHERTLHALHDPHSYNISATCWSKHVFHLTSVPQAVDAVVLRLLCAAVDAGGGLHTPHCICARQ
jgi:hypothetical protein